MRRNWNVLFVFASLLTPLLSIAQGPASVRNQVGPALGASALKQVVEILAADSMAGRPTPSPELEKSARYVAERFRAAGLRPFGDEETYLQRFPVAETLIDPDSANTRIGSFIEWRYGVDYRHIGGVGDPVGNLQGAVVIVTGAVTAEAARMAGISGKVVILTGPLDARGRLADYRPAFALGAAGAKAVFVPSGRADTAWNRIRRDVDEFKPSAAAAWPVWTADKPVREGIIRFMPLLELWSGRLPQLLTQLKLDSASLFAPDGTMKTTSVNLDAELRFPRRIARVSWPANVVGILEGTDPVLKHEYIIYTAHLDGLGIQKGGRPGPESILNGADDNASGTASIIQIAETFARSSPRPKRSIVFVAVAGEEKGLWGSDHFASHLRMSRSAVVANINLDMVGRASGDTVYILGRDSSKVGRRADAALRNRAQRRLTILGERELEARFPGERSGERSDMVNFTRRGIPALHFFTGFHDDYHATTDDAGTLNYDALSRIALAAYDIGKLLANTNMLTAAANSRY